jgi:hypothetical protein
MMDTDTDDKKLLIDKLENILALVNEWLKYSDHKLAGLTVLNGGIIWGYTRYLNTSDFSSRSTEVLNFVGFFIVIPSLFICVLGMLPVLKKRWFLNKTKSESDNVLFFGDIQKYRLHDYLLLVRKKLEIEASRNTPYAVDLANQIIINSEITTIKFQRTKFASWLTLLGSSVFISSILTAISQG